MVAGAVVVAVVAVVAVGAALAVVAEVDATFVGDAGRDLAGAFTVVVVVAVAMLEPVLFCTAGSAAGGAYLLSNFATFVLLWLAVFLCAVPVGRVVPCVFGLDEISRAAIWRVTEPMDAIP